MGTPLYNTDIIPMTSRPTLTVMDDGDYFVILDTSTGKISKILKTNIMTALKITYDNSSGLTAETVQAALDELVVNLGSSDSAISALAGRLDTAEGEIDDLQTAENAIKGTGWTDENLVDHEDRLDTLEGTGEGSVKKAIDDYAIPLVPTATAGNLAVFGSGGVVKDSDKKLSDFTKRINKNRIKVKIPAGFSWIDNPLADKIFTDGIGNFWVENFDVSDYEYSNGGTTYYVSPSGSDSNSGLTSDAPLYKIATALAKTDVDKIILLDGVYKIPNEAGIVSKSITIKAQEGAKPKLFLSVATVFWTKTEGYTNVYNATRNGTVNVIDTRYTDDVEAYLGYQKVDSIINCDTSKGSFFVDGTTVYVHTKDSSVPNNDWLLPLLNTNYNMRFLYSSGQTLYLEGIELYGGPYGGIDIRNEDATGLTSPKLYMKNVKQFYSNLNNSDTSNGINVRGVGLSIIQDCTSAHNYDDGFNYHAYNGVIPKFIEIGCVGRYNGVASGTDNGSTSHDGAKGIRINCHYSDNLGPNVADVHDNTETWNLGCLSHDSLCDANFKAQDGVAKIWLDGCISYGSLYDISVGANSQAEARIRNCRTELNNYVGTEATLEKY